MGTSTVSAAAPAPSPEGVTGWDDLAARLAALRSWAGGPSYAEIARRIRERRAERGVPPSEQMPGRSTIYDCFRPGRARVDVELFSDIVAVLASPAAVHRWRQALAAVEGRSAAAAVVRVDTLAAPQAALFVGRAPLVDDLLAEGRGSVSIVVGMPGVGKTELVLQVAALIAERQRPDVAIQVDLRGYDESAPPADPHAALGGILRMLGVGAAEIQHLGLQQRIVATQRAMVGRGVLVILDNARHADQVAPLLAALAGARVLVTSRRDLHELTGPSCRQINLGVLTLEDSLDFLTRACPETAVTEQVEAARHLVDLCGHLPLMLSLTVARIAETPAWTLADQVDRLKALPKADSIRPALTASYHALSAPAAHVFRAMSLHPGIGLTAAAVAAVADLPPDTVDALLDRLLSEHLIALDDRGHYRMHDLIWSYASRLTLELDPRTARDEALARLVEHYINTAHAAVNLIGLGEDDARPDSPTFLTDQDDAKAWLRLELTNTLTVAIVAGRDGRLDDLCRIAEAIAPWLEADGHLAEALTIHQAAAWSTDVTHRWWAARHLSRVYDLAGQFEQALTWAKEAVTCSERLSGQTHADSLNRLGDVYVRAGQIPIARRILKRSLDRAARLGDPKLEAQALAKYASVLQLQSDFATALELFERARELSRSVGDVANMRTVSCNLSDQFFLLGRYDDCERELRVCIEIDEKLGYRHHLPRYYAALGEVAAVRGEDELALAYVDQAIELARELRARMHEGEAMSCRGNILRRQHHYHEAVGWYRQALSIASEIESNFIMADTSNGLGEALLGLDRAGEAKEHFTLAFTVAQRMDEPYEQARARVGLGDCAAAAGDRTTALSLWQQAREHFDAIGSPEVAPIDERIANLV